MCCRYYVEMSPLLRPIIEKAKGSALTVPMVNTLARPLITEGEIRPTDIAAVLALNRHGQKTVFPMVWGFNLPRSKSPLINARVESACEKPAFKDSWQQMRCIIPASYYFEWEHLKDPSSGKVKTGDKYVIQPQGSEVTWLAGLYRIEMISGMKIPVFTILTTESLEEIRFIHERMPLIFPEKTAEAWIMHEIRPEELIKRSIREVIYCKQEPPADQLSVFDINI